MARDATDELMTLLREFHAPKKGANASGMLLEQIRNRAGFEATRTCDAMLIGLWPSRGLMFEGFELKTSRADWQRELADPSKAEAFYCMVDRWWLVVSDPAIVRGGELPETWGLLGKSTGVKGSKLRVIKQAENLAGSRAMGRSEIVAMLKAAESEGYRSASLAADQQLSRERELADSLSRKTLVDEKLAALREDVDAFEAAVGVPLSQGWYRKDAEHAARVGQLVKLALAGELTGDETIRRLERVATQAEFIASQARKALDDARDNT